MAIDKNSKAYQSLIKSGYTDEQINQMHSAMAGGQSAKDVLANTQKGATTTTTSTPKTTTTTTSATNTNTAKPEYQGTGGSTLQPKDTSWDQGNGNYAYNPTTGYYEKQGSQTSNQTSTTPSTTSTSNYPNADKIRQGWDNMTYEQQQEALKKNPALKENIARVGGTIKTAPDTGTTNTPTGTTNNAKSKNPDGSNWDYQDNSQARMDEIQDNLDRYRISNPELFDNYDDYYNFFIAGKGRTPEQEKVINDYFKRMKKYNQYDNMSSDDVGAGLVNGTIPDSYLNYIKNTDPQRYAEIQEARKKGEDKIKSDAALDTINAMTGEGTSKLKTEYEDWMTKFGIWMDEDNNGIDDRREHYASEEEKGYQKKISELYADILDIDNTVKHTYDDYVKAYPGATKATLMAMAQDTNSDLLREKENMMVELTKLQGYVGYMQAERQEMDKAGADSIAQLQKNFGMYYQYSPEGMSELAQAQYAATNITLDQADNGTDTQKQMALDSVLSDYYDKYGSIIQRSKSQVINDVMAYAKNNGVSLSQALQENFIKPLKSKPEYEQLNSITSTPNVVRIGTDANGNPIYGIYNSATGKFDPIDLSSYGISTTGYGDLGGKETTPGGVSYNTVSETTKINGLSDFLSGLNVGDYGGECGAFVNDYLEKIGAGRIYDNNLSTKLDSINSDTPEVGSVAIFDYSKAPAGSNISDKARKHGHVGIVVGVDENKGTVTIVESNKDGDRLISEPRELPISNLYLKGYFNPSKGYIGQSQTDSFGGKFANDKDWNSNGYFDSLVPYFKKMVQEGEVDLTDTKWKDVLADYNITSKEFNEMAKNYANTELKSGGGQQAANALEVAIKLYNLLGNDSSVPGRTVLQALWWTDNSKAKDEYNSLMKRLSLKELFAAKDLGATFGAMSDSEWNLLENAATDLNWYSGNFTENLEYLIESLYDAAIDGKATLPRNFVGSSTEQMLRTRKSEGSGIGGGKFQDDGKINDIYSDLF